MSSPKRRILTTGTFCSLNKGDAAMRIGLISALRRSIPDCHITIMTPFPELDRVTYDCDQILRCSRRRPVKALSMITRAAFWRIINTLFNRNPNYILSSELKAYQECDVVVDLSGDGLTEEYGVKCLLAHLVPIIIAKLLSKPVFICAQTIGPLNSTRLLCRSVLSKADSISAREGISYDHLSHLGLCHDRLSLSADMAFLMEPVSPTAAQKLLQAEGVTFDKPLAGLCVSRLPGHLLGAHSDRKPTNVEIEMSKTIDVLAKQGFRVVLISHTTGPGYKRDDRAAAARVAGLSESRDKVTVLSGDYSPQETKGIIGQMDLFAGVRMHSCISAMSMYVPTISIAYGPKAYGIMTLAGQAKWLVDIQTITAEKLSSLLLKAWESREAIKASLEMNIPKVQLLAQKNIEIIQHLLNGGKA